MTELKREEIAGHTIKRIDATEKRQGDLDITSTFCTLESGLSFFFPLACGPFVAANPPLTARRLRSSAIDRCLASPIARILAVQGEDGFIDPDSLVIQLASGDCLVDCSVAPHGTGESGLRVCHAGELDLSSHRDYWTLDRAADAHYMRCHANNDNERV